MRMKAISKTVEIPRQSRMKSIHPMMEANTEDNVLTAKLRSDYHTDRNCADSKWGERGQSVRKAEWDR